MHCILLTFFLCSLIADADDHTVSAPPVPMEQDVSQPAHLPFKQQEIQQKLLKQQDELMKQQEQLRTQRLELNTKELKLKKEQAEIADQLARIEQQMAHTNTSGCQQQLLCRCGNCKEMPTRVEQKCCMKENLNKTYLTDYEDGKCIVHCEEIAHILSAPSVKCAWLRHMRLRGYTGEHLDFTNMTNANYRYHAYRSYVDYIYGFLGKYNRRVIPACVTSYIRNMWPDESYRGFVEVDEDGNEIPVPVDEEQM